MRKKVMIVGAGVGQVNILKICQKRGYDVFVVSIPGNYPCFELTDNIRYADITDKEAVLKIAREECVDAIISEQNDMSVSTVAYVAEQLGLRGIGYETSQKFTNKYHMRESARAAGVPVPDYLRATTVNEAIEFADKYGFPLIIKPVDGWGSRGIHKINCREELVDYFEDSLSFSIVKVVIVEQFITGKEYLADGFAMDYEYITLDIGEKEYFDIDNIFVSKMCMFTSSAAIDDRVEKMVRDTNDKVVRSLGLQFGITHAEYMYSPIDDKVYLIEVAARGGGVYLSSDITPTITGFDTNEAYIDYAVEGKSTFPRWEELKKSVSAWVCFGFPDGEIISITGKDKLLLIDGVYKVLLDKVFVGMKTQSLKNDNGKYGPILIVADNKKQCRERIERVKDTLDIKIETENGIERMVW